MRRHRMQEKAFLKQGGPCGDSIAELTVTRRSLVDAVALFGTLGTLGTLASLACIG